MTGDESTRALDAERARRLIERALGIANYAVGLTLTFGGLALAIRWRVQHGGLGQLRAFYLHTAWAFGALQLLAATGMFRRWPVRWVLQLLPLVVPVIAYQYFVLHFIFRRL